MITKYLSRAHAETMTLFYAWAKTGDKDRLLEVKKELGPCLFRFAITAYLHEDVEKLERELGIPSRSAKAVFPIVADVLATYFKKIDTRIG